jgi:hypothetical protein
VQALPSAFHSGMCALFGRRQFLCTRKLLPVLSTTIQRRAAQIAAALHFEAKFF